MNSPAYIDRIRLLFSSDVHATRLMASVRRAEGLRLKPYRDTEGKLTIGYGRNLDDVGITEEEAERMLERDVREALEGTRLLDVPWPAMTPAQREVLVEMVFNMGLARVLTFKRMLQAIRRHDYERAAVEMLDSKWAQQVGERAERLATKMRVG